jgi:hypothetical protein
VTRKRSKRKTNGDAPITGVASGGLGTAANLDDTQVLSTADLQAAAPAWLDEPDPAATAQPDVLPPDELAALQTAPVPVAPPKPERKPEPAPATIAVAVKAKTAARVRSVRAAPAQKSGSASVQRQGSPPHGGRSMPALAGVVAVAVLLLVAGAGFLSQLDLGLAGVPAGGPASSTAPTATAPAATPEPKQEKGKGAGNGGCRGHGHGNDCGGAED